MRNAKGKRIKRADVGLEPGTWGGSQPNAGRKPGKANVRTEILKAISNKALMEGIKPIEVMLDNMRFFHGRAEILLDQVVEKLNGHAQDPEIVGMLVKLYDYRSRSQSCASDAAPYVHPRLSAIAVATTGDRRFALPPDLPLNEAMSQYEENLRRFPRPGDNSNESSSPKTIEHVSLKDTLKDVSPQEKKK